MTYLEQNQNDTGSDGNMENKNCSPSDNDIAPESQIVPPDNSGESGDLSSLPREQIVFIKSDEISHVSLEVNPQKETEKPLLPSESIQEQQIDLIIDKAVTAAFQRVEGQILSSAIDQLKFILKSGMNQLLTEVNQTLNSFSRSVMERIDDPKGRFYYNLQKSFLKGLIGIYDLIGEMERQNTDSEGNHQKNYKNIRKQFVQVFMYHDITSIYPKSGELFDPRSHYAGELLETNLPEENGLIAGCIREGFRFGEICLRPAEVQLKKYVPGRIQNEDNQQNQEG